MRLFLLTAAAVLALSGTAGAYNPLTGEDARLLGKDGRQMQGWLDYTTSRKGPDRYATDAYAELTYGLFGRLNLQVTVPWHGWNAGGISESGLGDVRLEAKFGCDCRRGWDLALKPGFSLPAGDEARSLGAGKGGLWLYGIASRGSGPWLFILNGGYMFNRNTLDERLHLLKLSGAAELRVLPELAATVSLSGGTDTDKSVYVWPVVSTFGAVWTPYGTLDAYAGVQLGLTAPAPALGVVAGLALRI